MKQLFKDFMINNNVNIKSVSSYFSYVKNAYETFMVKDIKKFPTIYERLSVLTKRSRIMYCEYIISLINAEIKNPHTKYAKKTLGNHKSGITMLKRFVASEIYPHNGKSQFTKKFSNFYTHDELIENFIWRLETQDRLYESGNSFPCDLFKKIFSKNPNCKKIYYDTLKVSLENTKFLVDANKNYGTLQGIDRLDILGGIKVWTKGNSYDVFTEKFQKKQYCGCIKTTGILLEDLSLDHDIPLENIVNREIDKLPELKRLSDAVIKHHKKTGLKRSPLTTSFYNNEYAKLAINEEQLLNEVISIYQYIEFTIMDKRFNSALSNNIILTPPLGMKLF